MLDNIFRILSTCLVLLLLFVIIASLSMSKKPTIIDGAKKRVSNFMYQPKAADMKNVRFYPQNNNKSDNELGSVCGEVFTFKNVTPYKYQRFIVYVSIGNEGKYEFSVPLFDFEGESIPEREFQKIWQQKCK